MRAIDLYSGVGGWSLGLKMAGIEVVASYEWWAPANHTNRVNNHHAAYDQDIRSLDPRVLPRVDVVVGSPPCTQFSFANRGGQGDIDDGLKDVYKFFEVIETVKPTFWAMENVPRVATILTQEMRPGGRLERFSGLLGTMTIKIINMEEFGVPQKRARCIAGNFDFDLLLRYRERLNIRTLGEVIRSLAAPSPRDPIYGPRRLTHGLLDHDLEEPLNFEEERMNRDAKTHHPVYNNMPFPDPMERPVRTITALCTRVSRESVVIPDERRKGSYRRLTVRERASLQSFPIDFQFFGGSHAQKIKLIGNAVPPLMSFYIGQAMQEVLPSRLRSPATALKGIQLAAEPPPKTAPETPKGIYNEDRRFRSALKGLRFKSGMRFELTNDFGVEGGRVRWKVAFYFGNSKSIHELSLDRAAMVVIQRATEISRVRRQLSASVTALEQALRSYDPHLIQRVWTRREHAPHHHPFEVGDVLSRAAEEISAELDKLGLLTPVLERVFSAEFRCAPDQIVGWRKLSANANRVLSGILVGAVTNGALDRPAIRKAA